MELYLFLPKVSFVFFVIFGGYIFCICFEFDCQYECKWLPGKTCCYLTVGSLPRPVCAGCGQWPVWPAAQGPWRECIWGGTAWPPGWPPAYGVHDDALYKLTAFTFLTPLPLSSTTFLTECIRCRLRRLYSTDVYRLTVVHFCAELLSQLSNARSRAAAVRNVSAQLQQLELQLQSTRFASYHIYV